MFLTPARAAIAIVTVATAGTIACSRPERLAADLLITHARIWTGNPATPEAAALAVIGDRIVDIGGPDAIERWRGANTTVLHAEGRRVLPGFNDAHVHFVDGGIELDNVDLAGADTPAEFARRIAERVKAQPGEWILGGNWNAGQWTPASLPTRQLIDDATNGTPVFVSRFDGRAALANSAALGRAGITERTPDPPGGTFARDPATGFPTGLVEGAAMDMVARVIPAMTPAQRLHAVKRALEHAASLGVTSVQDMNSAPEDMAVYADLAARDELTARIYAVSRESGWYDQAKIGVRRAFGSPWLRIGAVVGDFAGATDVGAMRIRLMAADHAGLQLCIDASGDTAISRTLDLFGDIVRANGGRDRRFRIEGAQAVAPEDVDRVASLGVVTSLQPSRAGGGLRTLAATGARLALGSGWTRAPLNPMLTLYAATTGATLDGTTPAGGVRQPMTMAEAVAAYTSGSAFAEFQGDQKGTLVRGALADFVILSDDILSLPATQIRSVHVLTTVVAGRVVHQRKP